jgi:hypothetical protein
LISSLFPPTHLTETLTQAKDAVINTATEAANKASEAAKSAANSASETATQVGVECVGKFWVVAGNEMDQ